MAYGEIHNSTGTICKALKSCPMEGGHSKDEGEYIDTKVEESGLDGDRVRAMVADGTPAVDALAIVREGIETQPTRRKEKQDEPKLPARTGSMGNYEMTDEKLDIHRVYPGERYYDADGNAHIVETAHRGRFATLNPIGADGVAPRNPMGSDGVLRVEGFSKEAGQLRRLEPPRDSRFVDGVAGHSESLAIKDLPKEGSWPRSVSAVLNYRDENGDQKSIELVAPLARLTDKKRIEIGKQLWAFTGKDPARFEEVPEKEQLRWASQRIMRRENYSWKTNDDGTVSYSHRMGGGGSHDGKDIKLLDL